MDTQNSIREYCQSLYVDIGKRLELEADEDESESKILLTVYQEKCSGILSALDKEKDDKHSDSQISTILKDIARLLLDVTYVEEVKLVEDEFPEDTAELRMKDIFDSFTSLATSISNIYPQKNVIDYLGTDIMECLQWRKGALLYMFCHTVKSRHAGSKFPSQYIHHLEDGINYFVKMFQTRSDSPWLESIVDSSTVNSSQLKDDTLQLIELGIFSDTHLLALMYCGELCYWYSEAGEQEEENAPRTNKACKEEKSAPREESHVEGKESIVEKGMDSSSSSLLSSKDKNVQCEGKAFSHKASHREQSCTSDCTADEMVKKQLRYVTIGNSCLRKYLSITNGPLAGANWSSSRAEEILLHFEKLKL